MGADAQSLVVRDVQTRLNLSGARVELRWIPQTVPVAFPERSTTLPTLVHQQLAVLGQRIAEHPELSVTILASDDTTRSATRTTTVSAALQGAGVTHERIRTTTVAEDEREGDRNVITVNVAINKTSGIEP